MAADTPTRFGDTASATRESLKLTTRSSMASMASTSLAEPTMTAHASLFAEPVLATAHVADDMVRQALWGSAPHNSTGLAYIQSHALRMRARVRREDPHTSYIPLRSKSLDVRLFKVATLVAATPLEHERCDFRGVTRVPGSLETVLGLLASEDARESYWVSLNTQRGLLVHSLVATRRLAGAAPFPRWNQRYSAIKFSKQAPPVECCVSEYADYDDEVRDEGEDDDGAALAARRTRLQSQDLVGAGGTPLRSAFIYRRSIDHRLFNMDDVQDKLRQYGERCERLYVQDLLYEVSETTEKHMCKVVLTCSVYLTNAHGLDRHHETESDKLAKSLRHEYREFCTQSLLSLRQVLSNQWVEKMAYAGVVSKSSHHSLRALLSGVGTSSKGHQPLHCGVCSAAFSLLKKRYVCHDCALVVCSRCCTKLPPPAPEPLPLSLPYSLSQSLQSQDKPGNLLKTVVASAQDRQSRRAPVRECILCTQFGNDGGGDALRVSVSLRRHFTNSTALSSVRSSAAAKGGHSEMLDETLSDSGVSNQVSDDQSDGGDLDLYLDDEEVHVVETVDDLDPQLALRGSNQSHETLRRSGGPVKPRNLRVRASTEDNTITTAWRAPEPEPSRGALPPTIAIQQPTRRRFKQRCESVNMPPSSSATPASPGLVLLTDIDTLSLTGSFRLDGNKSRRGSNASDLMGNTCTGTGSQRGSGASDTGRRSSGASDTGRRGSGGSEASASAGGFVRASAPAVPPRRAVRSVSEDTATRIHTMAPPQPEKETDEDEDDDDLANFNLQLL